jgi:predicted RNase H-like HicB family nuclease
MLLIFLPYRGDLAMKLRVVLEPSEDGGFTALVPSLPGCISEGDTREDALRNIREAVELYLEEDDHLLSANGEISELTF